MFAERCAQSFAIVEFGIACDQQTAAGENGFAAARTPLSRASKNGELIFAKYLM
jgi:hypothetical protein